MARLTMTDAGRIYLDHNAGAPLRPRVAGLVGDLLTRVGNPSSVHGEGRAARALVEAARAQVAGLCGVPAPHVAFTSGATEANVTALSPLWKAGRGERQFTRVLIGGTEHPSVTAGGRFPESQREILPVDSDGVVDVAALAARVHALSVAGALPLVAIQAANSETGVLQPLAEIARVLDGTSAILHVDAVQAAGRIAIDMAGWGAHSLALSAHKIGGPQGVGALVLRDAGLRPAPLLTGGGQENWNRAGTENVAAIAGFGLAAELVAAETGCWDEIATFRDGLERALCHIWSDTVVFGTGVPRLANTSCFAVPGVSAETALIALDLAGIAVSSGSACSSGKVGVSPVLTAMGVSADLARGAIRVSLGRDNGEAEIERFLAAWRQISGRIRQAGAGRAA
ncbi:cysteine desulfurase family protein [Stappia sp. MMSF_3263]|uniref:cysteine desulfurase family protein n=1 Tax=Stappia sp. MMSF_3263 TaxID=3046693 RepID=UPI00273CF959|nr:cysteine desulfurase family protein [Stappia sp. MMSF_3263]